MKRWNLNSRYGQGRILAYLLDHPNATGRDVQEGLNTRTPLVYRNLSILLENGYIRQELKNVGTLVPRVGFVVTAKGRARLEEEKALAGVDTFLPM